MLVPFPFSDLTKSKLRPAVVLAYADGNDWILCQITANPYADRNAIQLTDQNFNVGSLHRTSYVRPGKLFTANRGLIISKVGSLKLKSFRSIINSVVQILQRGLQKTSL